MKYSELLNLLKPFSDAECIPTPIIEPIEALSSFFSKYREDDEYIYQIGGSTIEGLKDLKVKFWRACKFIVMHQTEIEDAYKNEAFGLCLNSQEHKNDDILTVNEVTVMDGRVVDVAENHPYINDNSDTAWLLSSMDMEMKIDTSETAKVERLDYYNELYSLLKEDMNNDMDNPWNDHGIPVKNPKMWQTVQTVKHRFKESIRIIEEYLENETDTSREYDEWLSYTIPIAEIIDGKIFNEEIDGYILAEALSGISNPLTLRPNKETQWIHILLMLHRQGPRFCKDMSWLKEAANRWGISQEKVSRRGKDSETSLSKKIKTALDVINPQDK